MVRFRSEAETRRLLLCPVIEFLLFYALPLTFSSLRRNLDLFSGATLTLRFSASSSHICKSYLSLCEIVEWKNVDNPGHICVTCLTKVQIHEIWLVLSSSQLSALKPCLESAL